jgi:hypothetical protein
VFSSTILAMEEWRERKCAAEDLEKRGKSGGFIENPASSVAVILRCDFAFCSRLTGEAISRPQ